MKKIFLMAMPIAFLWSCYPAGPEYVEDIDAVYTTHDKEFDFKSRNTYAMPDKIVVDVEIDNGDTTYVYMADVFANQILQSIQDQMTAYGWEQVDPEDTQPDVVITPAGLSSTTYFYSYWYDWWYGGWYGGYWGWYYPPYYTVSSYTTGSLILVMADPNIDNPIGRSPTAWIGVANGLFTGSYDISRVNTAIDQMFAQSSYLKIN